MLHERSLQNDESPKPASCRNFGVLLSPLQDGRTDHGYAQRLSAGVPPSSGSLTYFISHNWSTRRVEKFLALALYFNGPAAIVTSVCSQLAMFSLVLAGVVPRVTTSRAENVCVWCTLVGAATFWIVLLLWHEMDARLQCRRLRVFFDKVCINQSDTVAKQEGIRNITAYLRQSEALLVLLSDVYLDKIWTVFELTAFMALKPDAAVIVQPLRLATIVACLMGLMVWAKTMEGVSGGTIYDHLVARRGPSILVVATVFGTTAVLRCWGRAFVQLEKQLNTFSFDTAQCLHPKDREMIREACFQIARGALGPSATLQESCECVELHARVVVPRAMRRAISPTLIPWRYALILYLVAFSRILDSLCSAMPTLQEAEIMLALETALEVVVESLASLVSLAIVGYFICYTPTSPLRELVRLVVLTAVSLPLGIESRLGESRVEVRK
ncbi:unnamed protein product, partial [Symbiodinium natans]